MCIAEDSRAQHEITDWGHQIWFAFESGRSWGRRQMHSSRAHCKLWARLQFLCRSQSECGEMPFPCPCPAHPLLLESLPVLVPYLLLELLSEQSGNRQQIPVTALPLPCSALQGFSDVWSQNTSQLEKLNSSLGAGLGFCHETGREWFSQINHYFRPLQLFWTEPWVQEEINGIPALRWYPVTSGSSAKAEFRKGRKEKRNNLKASWVRAGERAAGALHWSLFGSTRLKWVSLLQNPKSKNFIPKPEQREGHPRCDAAVFPVGSPAWGHPTPDSPPALILPCCIYCCFQTSENIFLSHQRTATFLFGKEIFLLKRNTAHLPPRFWSNAPILVQGFRPECVFKRHKGQRPLACPDVPLLPWAFTEWDFKAYKCVC